MVRNPLTQDEVRELLFYDLETGIFTRKDGRVAGTTMSTGYREISVRNEKWLAHRLAFLYVEGFVPKYVDHVNQVKSDNRWCNLRECSHTENMRNTKVRSNSITQVRNVRKHIRSGLYHVVLKINGVRKSFGYYKELEQAALVAEHARAVNYGSFKGN